MNENILLKIKEEQDKQPLCPECGEKLKLHAYDTGGGYVFHWNCTSTVYCGDSFDDDGTRDLPEWLLDLILPPEPEPINDKVLEALGFETY